MPFKTFAKGLAAGLLAAVAATAALADYPEKPVTMIIPLGAGGSHDLNARVIASVLPTYLGQPVIVQLMPGSAGQIGTSAAAEAPADGYTILFTQNFIDQLQQHVAELPYDPNEAFVAVARTNFAAPSVIVRSDSEFATMDALLASAKADPGAMTFGHSGNWGAFMVPGAMMFNAAGTMPTLVPHKGGGPAMQALLAGDVDVSLAFDSVIASQGDAVRPLLTLDREAHYEGVPTAAEAGLEGLEDTSIMHRVVLVHRDTPPEALDKLRAAFVAMQEDKTYQKLLSSLGENAAFMGGAEYEPVRAAQGEAYGTLVRTLTGQ
ncbi:tripartite tricarboxylate transporter substrate binding protein [Jannaschia aquimarina]|uniref:Tripartite tricarboxylate transporter family receptor n=1 Tax=Jannaschia aquimarina TaxID=935700 RepID=A0A0D1CRZ7_9RHOB|nr:tripartite tricarboxylate transporter substrate binding protein [Jannaschia aquimarina]KIT17577.1 Tripartite tricarboxylate transporter family receptor [Jannaschia aquimarina]SNS72384.1 Tripartite-type tricarboxylate transporter, receptor component TctC [Jannaschia aquimarina]